MSAAHQHPSVWDFSPSLYGAAWQTEQSVSSSSVADLILLLSAYMLIFVNVLSKTFKRIKEGNTRAKRSEFVKERKGGRVGLYTGVRWEILGLKTCSNACPTLMCLTSNGKPLPLQTSPGKFLYFIYPTSCTLACLCTFWCIVWMWFFWATICVSSLHLCPGRWICVSKGLHVNCLHCVAVPLWLEVGRHILPGIHLCSSIISN